MVTSQETDKIWPALIKAQKSFTTVPKNKTAKVKTKSGAEFSYKYADLSDVLSMAIPKLADNDLFFTQPNIYTDGVLRVVSRIVHVSGQWVESDGVRIIEGDDPQVFGSQSTYYRRYDGCSLLGIAPDEDTDGQGFKKTATTPAQATEQAKPKQEEKKTPEVHEADFRWVGDRLTVPVAAVDKKYSEKKKANYLVVWPDGTINGTGSLYVWDESLFDHLLGKAQRQTCSFEIDRSKKWWNITKVYSVGEDVIEDEPAKTERPSDEPF